MSLCVGPAAGQVGRFGGVRRILCGDYDMGIYSRFIPFVTWAHVGNLNYSGFIVHMGLVT